MPAENRWTIRLADLQVPRAWPLSVLAAAYRNRRAEKRQMAQAEQMGRSLAESVVQRWQEGDARTDALLKLTATLTHLTWVLAFLGVATLLVAAATLVVTLGN